MARTPLISGNWKMNLTHHEALELVQKLHWAFKPGDLGSVEVSIHPPFTDIRTVQTLIETDNMGFSLGAQNCYFETSGAFTGEVSPVFLNKLNVKYVIAGHSERRAIFGETDEMIAKKVAAISANGMTPILCVGETLDEREAGNAESVCESQLRAGFSELSKKAVGEAVIAYEPVWAIGTGKTCDTDVAQGMCKFLRSSVAQLFGESAAESVRIQYGGSVKAANAAEILSQPDIDGALVGGASLEPDGFAQIALAAVS